ncbi:hypothetical protein PISMIDRAFT_536993 [Pisolithus microcarpus 441]|uniref:Uncharacterized protein n=1 Tax=Pisolithus microcarpus 441 TaxID=765257 RepID=A0A0C9YL57_9AGAM|nr:hypothetical protein PISMIDRAFT_536993 [Pisolithus microcarpus 441]
MLYTVGHSVETATSTAAFPMLFGLANSRALCRGRTGHNPVGRHNTESRSPAPAPQEENLSIYVQQNTVKRICTDLRPGGAKPKMLKDKQPTTDMSPDTPT